MPDFFSLARSHAVRHIAELFPAVRGFHRFFPELTNPHPILCWRDRLDSNQRALEALYSFQDCPIMTTLVLSQEMPVSPGCHAADSAFALSPVNDRLPHPRIPLRLDGVSWASSMGAYYWAWIRSRRAEALWPLQGIPFFQVKNGQKLPRPSALIFTSAAPLPSPERIVLPWGWQWDSAHHGPVFPGCHFPRRESAYGYRNLGVPGRLSPPARHHTWLYHWAGITLPAVG